MTKALSKPLCFRLPYEEYIRVLAECDAKNITISEWIERQIAWSNKYHITKESFAEIIDELNIIAKECSDMDIKLKLWKFKRWLNNF